MNKYISPPYLDWLDPARQKVFKQLALFADEFVLAGGTGIMLQIGHRMSYDFDCFTIKKLRHDLLLSQAKSIFGRLLRPLVRTDEILSLITSDQVEITFISHPYLLLNNPIRTRSISIFHLDDLAANKTNVIGRRPAWRDYIDLFILLKWKLYTTEKLINLAQKKFMGEFHDKLFLQQLTYFNDLEIVPVKFLKKSYSVDEIKSFLESEVQKYLKKVL